MRATAIAVSAGAVAAQASCAPQQFFTNFLNTVDSLAINWATNCSSSTVVTWGTSADKLTNTVIGQQSQYTFGLGTYTSPFLHHTEVTGLPTATKIYYTVGGDASGTSSTMSVTTNPGPGLSGARFAIIGDLGQTSNSVDTVAHIQSSPSPFDALIHAGDLSYADNDEPRWDSWQQLVAPLAQSLPWMTIVGNHEIELDLNLQTFEAYDARFTMPYVYYNSSQQSREKHYSFEAGGVHWLMLSSYTDFSASSAQMEWLHADLAAVDRAVTPWLLAVLHAPWYNSNNAHQGEGEAMRVAVEATLYAAGVDVIFAGHVHAYERCYRSNNMAVNATGAYHITIGDGGNREGLATNWNTPQPAWSAFRQASYGHGELEVVNATALHWTWHQNPDLEPTVADELWVVKGASSEADAYNGALPEGVTSQPRLRKSEA